MSQQKLILTIKHEICLPCAHQQGECKKEGCVLQEKAVRAILQGIKNFAIKRVSADEFGYFIPQGWLNGSIASDKED